MNAIPLEPLSEGPLEPEYPEWRKWEIAEKYLDRFEDYGDWKDDYADAVCIPRHGEL